MSAPKKGDIVLLEFTPQSGHEQGGKRPAVVLSEYEFNRVTGFAIFCPITSQKKGYPFEVKVTGAKRTTGVILSDQIKSLDWRARNAKVVDNVDKVCLSKIKTLILPILGWLQS